MKTLTINGDLYAKYEIEGDRLFLKMIKEIIPGNPEKSEDWIITTIQLINSTSFKMVGYLNV